MTSTTTATPLAHSAPGFLASGAPVAGLPAGSTPAPATTGADGSPGAPLQGPPPASPGMGNIMFLMLGLLGLMIFMQIWAGRKDKKKRQELLSNLKRHDKVLTVGGIVGTVAEVRDDEVVLKVDESTNTKIRFAKSSIQQVVKQSSGSSDEPAAVERAGA